jgi:tetratricopeptide (TPR) repeat protein
MLIVEPPALRFEAGEGPLGDEHLLERISTLENRFLRLTEKLERGLDLLLRQAQNSYFDRALIKALISLLTEDGLVEPQRLERLWNDRCRQDAANQEESARREERRLRILASYDGSHPREFEQLVNEGFLLIDDGRSPAGIKTLQRACALTVKNSALLSFVGEYYFGAGKTKLAREYLSLAHEAEPNNLHLSLLLGLTCADDGDAETAKELLNNATRRGGSSFAGHYGLGCLFAAESNWRKAIREFKRALTSKPSPEAHYVLASLYYQLSRDSLALRHLLKATEMDSNYFEAFQLLARVYERCGQVELAGKAYEKAVSGHRATTTKKRKIEDKAVNLLFQGLPANRKLVTGVDRRLAQALREDALKAFVAGPEIR